MLRIKVIEKSENSISSGIPNDQKEDHIHCQICNKAEY